MKFESMACLGLLILFAGASGARDGSILSPEQVFERVAASVWTVETFDAKNQLHATGSGVVVGPGSVITNCHVLARARRVAIARENVSYGATLGHSDPDRDLCLLKVANLEAPPVVVAGAETLKIGARVYAVGSPRGFEQTISDGVLSGLRRSSEGALTALQITAPISPGSSGGGLFDSRGRLIGITTFAIRDAQNVNFAMPAGWIAEISNRAWAGPAAQTAHAAVIDSRRPPVAMVSRLFEYQLRNRLTGATKPVIYRLERMEDDRLIFNQGSRVEKPGGGVLSLTAAIGGDFDEAMPPGGWVSGEPQAGATWDARYESNLHGQRVAMRLRARTLGESKLRLKDQELRVVGVKFTGYTSRGPAATNPSGSYTASAWYSPELGRIVRFEARSRGGLGATAFIIDEVLELVDIRSE